MNKSFSELKYIGLALSGGGVRAASFHAGVFKWLAEQGKIEQIEHISSVSGGSLFIGLVFHFSGYSFPSSEEYLEKVYPHIKKILIDKSLFWNAVFRLLLNPFNWRFFISRANVFAESIQKYWGITGTLGCLPQKPIWSINGTTAENGKRFRFKNATGGDYDLGYADFSDFELAKAMAVSAAFPAGIGPLAIETNEYVWLKSESWNSANPPSKIIPKFYKLHIYDGGLYDNLGMEPLFDIGKREIKISGENIDFLIISDAGAELSKTSLNLISLLRIKRFMDIVMSQARALRVRAFVDFLQKNPSSGMYLQIGSNPINKIKSYKPDYKIDETQWLSSEKIEKSASFKTSLNKMTEEDFDMISRHGYETVKWNFIAFFN